MAKSKSKAILVFGENDNDRSALIEIAKALAPEAKIHYEKRNKPLILASKQERAETVRSTEQDIAKLVKVAQVRFDVLAIIAHRDCDDIEPAHVKMATDIKANLQGVGVKHIVAATPAFELEAWWLLFPNAAQAVCKSWRHFTYNGINVGMIRNAKEHLTRALRPKEPSKRQRCPEYSESDSVRIAREVGKLGGIRIIKEHQCGSLTSFVKSFDSIFEEVSVPKANA